MNLKQIALSAIAVLLCIVALKSVSAQQNGLGALNATEPIVGYRLPGKSGPCQGELWGVGKKEGLRAVMYGRKSDLIMMFNTKTFQDPAKIYIHCGLLLTRIDEHYGSKVIDRLEGMGLKVTVPKKIAQSVKPGHVLIVMDSPAQIVALASRVRKEPPPPPPAPPPHGAPNPQDDGENSGCDGAGKVCIDTEGHLSVALSCDGVEVEASSSGEFEASVSLGSMKLAPK